MATIPKPKRKPNQTAPKGFQAPDVPGQYFYHDFWPYTLNQVTHTLNQRFKRELKAFELSVSQWRVMASLTTADDLSLTEVSSYTGIDQPTLSRLLDQLVERGLVTRMPRPTDGRFAAIALAPEGRELLSQVWPMTWELTNQMAKDLDEEEKEMLLVILRKLLQGNRQ
jgi:DNA-binding MarR family transcriptional regulator